MSDTYGFEEPLSDQLIHRRHLIAGSLGGAAISALGSAKAHAENATTKGRIKQSIVSWCFSSAGDKWSLERICQTAKELGCVSVELVGPDQWSTLRKYGLVCAIAPSGMSFKTGYNNPRYQPEVIAKTTQVIDKCAEAGFPSVIAFTGFKWRDADDPNSGAISSEEGADNCVSGLKKIAAHAERKGVTVCLEHLNTRDDTHRMKGHPGYQGDDLDYCASIIRRVGSPNVKLLFDIYHVQIMHGDVMRRLDEVKDILGHVHTAGNPGRGELDDNQEINYPPIMRKLVDIGYKGYVGQEFIPTRDPYAGLQQAVGLCDV